MAKIENGLFVIRQTGDKSNGGVESITQILEQLPVENCTIVTQNDTERNKRWQAIGYKIHVWKINENKGALAPVKNFIQVISVNLKFLKLLKSEKIKFIHCNDTFFFWKIIFAAKLAGIKLVLNIRDTKGAHQHYDWTWRWLLKLSYKIIYLSHDMLNYVTGRILKREIEITPASKHQFIYSIVNTTRFAPADKAKKLALRDKYGVSKDAFVAIYVATFNVKKAQLPFIQSLGGLFTTHPNFRIIFIGDFYPEKNKYAAQCLSVVKELGMENNISFNGFSPNVEEWYQLADISILASQREGLARCMIECITCGVPFVSFDVASAKEMLEKYNCGFVAKQGDYAQFVKYMVQLKEDRQLRETLGNNGRKAGSTLFVAKNILDKYSAIYNDASLQAV